MAVGDVINGISADNTALTFQPSVGSSVIITSISNWWINDTWSMTNGVVLSHPAYANSQYGSPDNMKMMTNNTIYLTIPAVGVGHVTAYSGIQIQ